MKIKIFVSEKVLFEHEVILVVPEDKDIDDILDKAENGSMDLDDVLCSLERQGCEILEVVRDESGSYNETEIFDFTEC